LSKQRVRAATAELASHVESGILAVGRPIKGDPYYFFVEPADPMTREWPVTLSLGQVEMFLAGLAVGLQAKETQNQK
jgi:hypothetical protein